MSLLQVLNGAQAQARTDADVQQRYDNATGASLQSGDPYAGMLTQLDNYVENCWQAAKSAKEYIVEPEMLEDARQREGQYSPTKLAEIKKMGGSEIFMQLTNIKCRAAEGWVRDILLPSGERPFRVISPKGSDDLPPEIKQQIYQQTMGELQQAIQSGLYVQPEEVYERSRSMYDEFMQKMRDEATIRAEREEDAIDDELIEAHWYEALDDMISDLVGMPTAFLKGPVIRRERRLEWVPGPNGRSVPQAVDELTPLFYSPSPFDIYPAPDSCSTDDGYLCEKLRLRRADLARMKGIPGYDSDKIMAALAEYQHAGHEIATLGEQQRRLIAGQYNYQLTPDHPIEAIEFHGSVRGAWLIEWGLPPDQVPDIDAEYETTCIKVGRFVIRCALNEDPLGRRPYMMASFDPIKGQFWGRGVPRLLRDLQTVCNAAARALVNNMGMASGPMYEVEVDRLAPGEDATLIYPWRMFQTQASKTTPGPAIRFFMPPDISTNLMRVFDYFSKEADEYCGIPSYEQGINPTNGAAGTASGLSMLMTAASRQIKRVIASVDKVIEGSVQRMHTHIMLYGDNPDIKGDLTIEARGAASLIAKEQMQVRQAQFLQATANPLDSQIMGQMGRAELLRRAVQALDMDPDDIVPSKDQMLANQRQQQLVQQQAAMQASQGMPPQSSQPPVQQHNVVPMRRGSTPLNKLPRTVDAAGNAAGGAQHGLFGAMRRAAA